MKTTSALLFVLALAAAGCDKADPTVKKIGPTTTDLGTGLNAIERTYDRPASGIFDAVASALKSFDLKLESDQHDELGGELVALRADGHKVTAKITSMDKDHSRISVRVAPGNRELAEMIHQRISEKLVPAVK